MIALFSRHLIDSTLFCMFTGALASCLPKQRAAARYSLWLIGVLKFAVPTAVLAATGARVAFLLPAGAALSALAARFSSVMASLFGWLPAGMYAADADLVSIVFLTIWLLGVIVTITRWAIRYKKSGEPEELANDHELAALARAQERLGISRVIGISSSGSTTEPSLHGILRPVIRLPHGLSEQLTAGEFESVLLHELAHVRRHDNLTSALVHCLVCVFWFHPLLWLAQARLLAERERACDELVVGSGASAQVYLTGILKVCRFHLFGHVAGVSAMTASDFETRLELILSGQRCRPMRYVPQMLLATGGMLMTLLPIAGGYCDQCVSNSHSLWRDHTLWRGHSLLRSVIPAPCESAATRKTPTHSSNP